MDDYLFTPDYEAEFIEDGFVMDSKNAGRLSGDLLFTALDTADDEFFKGIDEAFDEELGDPYCLEERKTIVSYLKMLAEQWKNNRGAWYDWHNESFPNGVPTKEVQVSLDEGEYELLKLGVVDGRLVGDVERLVEMLSLVVEENHNVQN